MEKYSIVIAKDYSDKPGGRWIRLGPNSGEDFYQTLLLPKFKEAIEAGESLYIYLDGTRGYPSSFLDQSFGELARTQGVQLVRETLVLKATVFQWVVDYITKDIWDKTERQ